MQRRAGLGVGLGPPVDRSLPAKARRRAVRRWCRQQAYWTPVVSLRIGHPVTQCADWAIPAKVQGL